MAIVLLVILTFFPLKWSVATSLALISVCVLFDFWSFIHFQKIYPTASFVLFYLTIIGLAILYRYFTEEREKAFVKGAFEKYVSPKLVKSIMNNPSQLNLGGEKKKLTVLFSDLRDFTSLSEKMGASELSKFLNDYLTPMSDVVMKFDGTVDKYMGDAIMAIFGAPIYFENHAQLAVEASLEMLRKLKELNEIWKSKGLSELIIGIGINTGDMSVGNMGSQKIFSYTVMGDAVNLASRLESLNKEYATHLIVGEATFRELGSKFACRKIDKVRVKGKSEPVEIYEVISKQLSNEKSKLIDAFQIALNLYFERNFSEALLKFKDLSSQDPTSAIFAQRCELFIKNAPPSDWDGTWTMTKK
jgi:adenylate cyclase